MRIGGVRQEVLSGAQNHLDGHHCVCEVRGVRVPPPPNLNSLKQSESLRHMVKRFGAPNGIDFRHVSIVPVLGAEERVNLLESKGYMSSAGARTCVLPGWLRAPE